MDKQRKRHGEGSYNLRISEVNDIEIADFVNPWTFHTLFMACDDVLYNWLRSHGLLANTIECHCSKIAKLNKRQRLKDGFTFRCPNNHEFRMRKHSFFQGSEISEILLFS